MKYLKAVLFTLMIFLIGCDKEDVYPTAPNNPDKELLLRLINNYRTSGCTCGSEYFQSVNPIVWNDTIELAAKIHSIDMNNNDFFDHTGSDGSNAGNRLDSVNYSWSTWGENIAKGYISEQQAVEGWVNSVGHCKNIMNGNFQEMGIATSGDYWTQVFGSH